MTINQELEAKILRYHFVEHWGPHTIAAQLGIHHSTVDRVLSQAGMPKAKRTRRVSIIDPYLPFIIETLAQYPKLTATRLYTMAQQRGYPGGPNVSMIAVTSIALMAAPIMREPPRCAEPPNATVQLAVAGTVMRIDSVGFGRVNKKK